MKFIALLLAAALLLCGCIDGVGEKLPEIPEETTEATPETGLTELPLPERSSPETMPREEDTVLSGQTQAAFSILENDDSIRNAAGDILVKICYEQVILDTSVESWQGINRRLQQDYLDFRGEMAWLWDTTPEEWEAQMKSMGFVYGNLLSVCGAEVTNNSGSLFSVRVTRDWFLGGVYNRDYYGMTFDLASGEEVPLARLSDLSEEDFARQLKEIVCGELSVDTDGLAQDPAQVLQGYALEDFLFYIDEGELVLTFPTYTLGPGAMGAVTVKTGLYPQL